ncbi:MULTISPECIES: hypothetical protein [unclassified Mesotoga]|uniref:hypothetical protein n=1 Tax=unclassified Mesotoga TaxID=1184398 RepID=UPI000DA6D41D|nr:MULTISPECIES: hypothetical protein [unclassified Mesotoga]PZC52296.1 hypothetical protein LH53_05630 [Mesotoga sp. TolDC]
MNEVTGVRIKLPELTTTDFKYNFLPVYEKDWFSINLSLDSKEFRGTLGFRIKPPFYFHVGGAWNVRITYFDLLIGFELRF